MRIILSLTFLFIIYFNKVNSQNCIPTAIVFSNQAQVDAFPSNYPGCTIIDGNVGITGSVQNLDSLIQVTKIGGSVSILNATSLSDLDGLNNISRIEGSLTIHNYRVISNLTALINLDFIGGSFNVSSTDLYEYDGLNDLDTIGGGLSINSSIYADLSGISNIDYIGSTILLNTFSNLGGIINLDTLRGDLILLSSNISDFTFPNLVKLNGSLTIQNCNNLGQISGFNNLSTITGPIYLYNTSILTTISGFNNLDSVNGITISNSPFSISPSYIPFLALPLPNIVVNSSTDAQLFSAFSISSKNLFLSKRTGVSCFSLSIVSPSTASRMRFLKFIFADDSSDVTNLVPI